MSSSWLKFYYIQCHIFMEGYGGLGVSIGGPGTAEINCEDNGDGTCRVTYKPTAPGIYDLHVKYADQEIPGDSPLSEIFKCLTFLYWEVIFLCVIIQRGHSEGTLMVRVVGPSYRTGSCLKLFVQEL